MNRGREGHVRTGKSRLAAVILQKGTGHRIDPDQKSCSIQKQNSGMIYTPLNGGCADENVTIHRRADCFCPEAG
ncbi:hypothetical protein CI789_01175 [Erwinia persicina]|nr:hypothetical protein CI789_01175 [Erwinia persicina]